MTDDQLVSKNKKLAVLFYILCFVAIGIIGLIFLSRDHLDQRVQIRVCGKESKYEEESNYQVDEKMINHQLYHFIELLRTLTYKKELYRNWQDAHKLSTGKALRQNYQNYEEWAIGEALKKDLVSYLQLEKIEKETKTTYRVHWNESLWSYDQYIGKSYYYGFFVIEIREKQKESDFIKNPTGIYIKEYSIAEKEF